MGNDLVLDDKLVEEARRVGNHRTQSEALTAALAEYIDHRKRLRILELEGTIDFDPSYDYKAERRSRS